MTLQTYHYKVLRYLHLSRQAQTNAHLCPKLGALRISTSPDTKSSRALSSGAGVLASISGGPSRVSVRVNRRSKESFLAGSCITLRRSSAYAAISCLLNFSFYNSANFRGLLGSPQEVGASYRLAHLEFFLGSSKAFNGSLTGFGDDSSATFLSLSFNRKGYAVFFLRGLKLPAYP
uniref:Ribosomal protein L5 n=1 Tax=Lotharella oceanica TaxID=641309 RepID=A0A140GYQ4_9EUKA|nr:ribosomal protein L5 [Lotharella oceanica]AMN87076.1 ribosomal protein L5 [Lotharella oceanica]